MRSILKENVNEEEMSKYQKFFKDMLDAFGYDSPADMDKDTKEKFFGMVDDGWNANKDTVDQDVVDKAKEMKTEAKVRRRINQIAEKKGISKKAALKELARTVKKKRNSKKK